MTDATATERTVAPTERDPEVGSIAMRIGDEVVDISEVEHWIEDDLHVFRSTEFDCTAEADDEWDAVRAFLDNAGDLFRFLDDVVDAGRATEDEVRTLIKLSRRFFEVSEASEREEQRRRLHILRRQALRRPQWQRSTTHVSSSKLSHA